MRRIGSGELIIKNNLIFQILSSKGKAPTVAWRAKQVAYAQLARKPEPPIRAQGLGRGGAIPFEGRYSQRTSRCRYLRANTPLRYVMISPNLQV